MHSSKRRRDVAGTFVAFGTGALLGRVVGGDAGVIAIALPTTFFGGYWLSEWIHGRKSRKAREVIGVLLAEGAFLKDHPDIAAIARWRELLQMFILDAYGAFALLDY